MKHIKEQGYEEIILHVAEWNQKAMKLYLKNGFVSKKGKKFVRFKFSGAKQNVYYLDFPFLILRTWGCYHVNKIIKEKDSYGAKTVPGNHAHKNMRIG